MTDANEAAKPAPMSKAMPIAQHANKRKIRNPNRYKDDGTYDNKPLDINYFRTYYHTKGAEQVECATCGCQCKRSYLYRHTKTGKCSKLAINKATN